MKYYITTKNKIVSVYRETELDKDSIKYALAGPFDSAKEAWDAYDDMNDGGQLPHYHDSTLFDDLATVKSALPDDTPSEVKTAFNNVVEVAKEVQKKSEGDYRAGYENGKADAKQTTEYKQGYNAGVQEIKSQLKTFSNVTQQGLDKLIQDYIDQYGVNALIAKLKGGK